MKRHLIACYSWSHGDTKRINKELQTDTGAEIRHPLEVRFDSSGDDHMETSVQAVHEWTEAVKKL